MKIVLATPLYPPEVADEASYVKELAKRLLTTNEVTVAAYAHLPEAIPGVSVIAVDKQQQFLLRLASYARTLLRVVREADVLYVVNGASVELPAALVATVTRVPLVLCIADQSAHERTRSNLLLRTIERLVSLQAKRIITDLPLQRPEIMPLLPYPTEAMAAYEASWSAHIRLLTELFHHVA